MSGFNASLVREKIVFTQDKELEDTDLALPDASGVTTIRSNRMFLKAVSPDVTEQIVVRSQNMHTTLRLAARIMDLFYKTGPFASREENWDSMWDYVLSDYEKVYNAQNWASIYMDGHPVFRTIQSPFVDVIERCALLTLDNYDDTMNVTEEALHKIGKTMYINHNSNVAATFVESADQVRCGIIQRKQGQDITHVYTLSGGAVEMCIVESMELAAMFLEGMNLRYIFDDLNDKEEKTADDFVKRNSIKVRLSELREGIKSIENVHTVKYRPEKPALF